MTSSSSTGHGEPTRRDPHRSSLDVVTGAFSYSGAAIARNLQAAGRRVRPLTGHPQRRPTSSPIEVRPLSFDDSNELVESLRGAETLYNTYWVRFPHGRIDFQTAVANSRALFEAAHMAAVERIVHVSITHADLSSPYAYFRGKAEVEQILTQVGVSFTILRPATLFGGQGVLLNNIAWLLRRLPVFAIGGSGDYRIRPIHVDDLARLAVKAGADHHNEVVDAVGPERPTFEELVRLLRDAVHSRARLVHVPSSVVPHLATLLGLGLRDRLLTADEYRALEDGLADTDGPFTGEVRLSHWVSENAESLGVRYANELGRHFEGT
ncbi:MAG TPA: NAD(P)H-binding protein [Acidimicrobiales bacterium]|nr:NAD(P)H-binding protein [Acidimicrobiales bacterium]